MELYNDLGMFGGGVIDFLYLDLAFLVGSYDSLDDA